MSRVLFNKFFYIFFNHCASQLCSLTGLPVNPGHSAFSSACLWSFSQLSSKCFFLFFSISLIEEKSPKKFFIFCLIEDG